MTMLKLDEIVNNLKAKSEVDAVFLTGSQGSEHKSYSDIDLVVIFDKHKYDLTSLYTWTDDTFADIFFFDHADLKRIEENQQLPANAMDGVFVSWLEKASILFDKSGKLTALKNKKGDLIKKIEVPKSERDLFWQKINYNFVANRRYFESNDPLYHEALDIRLLYSVSEILTGYFEFRNIPWRGEKTALKHLKQNDQDFHNAFVAYTKAATLNERFDKYTSLAKLVFTSDYKFWNKGDVLPQSKDRTKVDTKKLAEYWQDLIRK